MPHLSTTQNTWLSALLALAMLALLLPATAQAGERFYYIGGSFGDLENDEYDDSIYEEDNDYGKLFAGIRINRHLAVEVAYHDLGEERCCDYPYPVFDDFAPYGYTREREAYSAAVLGILPFERFELFGKAGFLSREDGSTIIGFPGPLDNTHLRGDMIAGVGAQVPAGEHFAFRLEWELIGVDHDSLGAGSIGLAYTF